MEFTNDASQGEKTNTVPDEAEPTDVIYERKLKKAMVDIVGRLGIGLCDPEPYDTAWVARVPLTDNLERPAFPLSLQWLRDNQQENGSWGAMRPLSPHSSTLNTLAAIVSLAQWNNPEDEYSIQRGIKALWNLAPQLPTEVHEGVGFELILPKLQNEARKFGLDIPHEYYQIYEQKGRKKLELILREFEKYGYSKPATWWHSLEILGDNWEIKNAVNNEIEFSPLLMLENGSVGASPSATAYLLRSQRLKGRDIPEAEDYLQRIYSLHEGGICYSIPIDIFELAFSLDFFLKAGFSAKDPLFSNSIALLSERCSPRETIGFSSSYKVPDADDIAIAMYVLHQAGYQESVEGLLKFFNGNHFSGFIHETNSSLSVNINALNTLRLFQDREKINLVIGRVAKFLEKLASHDGQVFVEDKWNRSPYYSTSRAVFSLHGLRDDVVRRCIMFFIDSQNEDGGWGRDGFSTAEESAYVVLALCFARKNGYRITEDVLKTASEFLSKTECRPDAQLWLGKVVYRPTLVAESAVLAAKYALAKILELTEARATLRDTRLFHVHLSYYTGHQRTNTYNGYLLSFSPKFDGSQHSEQVARVENYIVNRLMKLEVIKNAECLRDIPLNKLIHIIRSEVSDEHLIFLSFLGAALTIIDDILDENCESYKNRITTLEQVFQTFMKILKGELRNMDIITPLEFPRFIPLCRLFLDMRQRIPSRCDDIREFLKETKKFFDSFTKELDSRFSLTSEEYLEITNVGMGVNVFSTVSHMFKDVNGSLFENYKFFQEFKYYGLRAARLVAEILSFPRAQKRECLKNYVLLKLTELSSSIEEALDFTVKLYNRFVIKMLSIKRMIQSDPEYKDNQDLFKAISIIECHVDGIRDWASETLRYRSSSKTANINLSETINQLTVSDLTLIIDEKTNNYTYSI